MDTDVIRTYAKSSERPQEKKGESSDNQMGRLLKENRPEMIFVIIGCLATVSVAAMMPILAVLFGRMLNILSYSDIETARTDSLYYALAMLLLAAIAALSQFLQGWMLSIAGENLTKRLRRKAFRAILSQEMAWHDEPENNTGSLCARLSGDAGKVQGASGSRIGTVLHAFLLLSVCFFHFLKHKGAARCLCHDHRHLRWRLLPVATWTRRRRHVPDHGRLHRHQPEDCQWGLICGAGGV